MALIETKELYLSDDRGIIVLCMNTKEIEFQNSAIDFNPEKLTTEDADRLISDMQDFVNSYKSLK